MSYQQNNSDIVKPETKRMKWSPELHEHFVRVVEQVGVKRMKIIMYH
jgi:hypothetical protein